MPRLLHLSLVATLFLCPLALGQEEATPLGDLARSFKKAAPPDESRVIDNDNLPLVMDRAESERLNGKPVFSIDPSGKSFRITSPDGSCSLSFDAKATALISSPYVSSSLPLEQLARLDGTASIRDGVMEVSVHNGTGWELREIVVGVTLLSERSPLLRSANLLGPADGELIPKGPDLTMLYHLKASAAPEETAVFRGNLDQDFGPATDWHWALVGARGIPPAPDPPTPALPGTAVLPGVTASQPLVLVPAGDRPLSHSNLEPTR
jgi:hypothetical protein